MADFDVDDLAAFEAEFDKEWKEPEEEVAAEEEEEIVDESEEEVKEEPETKEEVKADDVKSPVQTAEANRAFQQLRIEAEANKKYADFVKNLADSTGMTPEEYLKAAADYKLEKEAVALGKDPELYKKTAQQQAEIDELKNFNSTQAFQAQIDNAQRDLKLTNEQVSNTLVKGVQMGLDVTKIPFETLHNLVNPVDVEAVRKEAAAKAIQDHLEEEKRKQDSYVPHSSGGSTKAGNIDVKDEVAAFLREKGDIQ